MFELNLNLVNPNPIQAISLEPNSHLVDLKLNRPKSHKSLVNPSQTHLGKPEPKLNVVDPSHLGTNVINNIDAFNDVNAKSKGPELISYLNSNIATKVEFNKSVINSSQAIVPIL